MRVVGLIILHAFALLLFSSVGEASKAAVEQLAPTPVFTLGTRLKPSKEDAGSDKAREEDAASSKKKGKKAESEAPSENAAVPKTKPGNLLAVITIAIAIGLSGVSAALYFTLKSLKRRNRELRYIQSSGNTYLREGDGKDIYREML
jgi:hypothetical protein